MRHSYHLWLCVLAACLLAAVAPGGQQKGQEIKGWGTVVDPDGDCKVTEAKGKLTITVPRTHHDLTYTAQTTKLNAPRVLQKVRGDFQLDVKVLTIPLPGKDTSSSGVHSFNSCGLLVWQDDRNFIRMDRAAEGNGGGEFVWVERFTDGRTASRKLHSVANKVIQLRVVRDGDRLTFSINFEVGGAQCTEIYTDEVRLVADVQVGVLAINTTTNDFFARMQGFQITPKK